jgi:uncharacterized membrane protein YccC
VRRIVKGLRPGEARGVARAAFQSAAAAVATYLALRAVGSDELLVGILSSVYILTPTIGGTMSSSLQRVTATLIGSAIGIACLLLLPDTWGTVAALGLSMLVLGGVSHLRPAWTYGMVAAVALSLHAEEQALSVALDRGTAIAIGAAVGTLATFIVWPERAATRFHRRLAAAQGAIARHAAAALDRARGTDSGEKIRDAERAYHDSMAHAREAASVARFPRGGRREELLHATDRLYHSLTLIDRAIGQAEADPVSRREDFGDRVEALREKALEVLDIVRGDAEGDAKAAFNRLGEETRRARAILAGDDMDDDGHLRRATLLFGMEEVREALGQFFDELRQDEEEHRVGTTLRRAGARRVPD